MVEQRACATGTTIDAYVARYSLHDFTCVRAEGRRRDARCARPWCVDAWSGEVVWSTELGGVVSSVSISRDGTRVCCGDGAKKLTMVDAWSEPASKDGPGSAGACDVAASGTVSNT